MSLACLSLILGIVLIVTAALAFARPGVCTTLLKAFPRSLTAGYIFLVISTVWFLWNFQNENISDFANIKKQMFLVFIVLAVGVGVYVRDFLAVRTYSIFLFLVAKLIYDTARYAESSWAVLFPSVATVLVIFGMWFTATPWRMRDMITWLTNRPARFATLNAIRATLGIIFLILGITGIR